MFINVLYLGGFVPKDSPSGAIYLPDKFRKTTEQPTNQPTVHHEEPVMEKQPIGSGNFIYQDIVFISSIV